MPAPLDTFEPWLLRRVAEAVEAGRSPASLLTELRRRSRRPGGSHRQRDQAAAILQIAQLADVDREKAAEVLASMRPTPR